MVWCHICRGLLYGQGFDTEMSVGKSVNFQWLKMEGQLDHKEPNYNNRH